MHYQKNEICEEQRKIIGIEPVIDIKNFMMLLLADLASKSPIYHIGNVDLKTACLRTNYKEIIENIMYQENGWGIKFATLIDIYSYYEFQQEWETKLGTAFDIVLSKLNKKVRLDFENDIIEVEFTTEEIMDIKSQYDRETLIVMDHFSNLMSAPIFTRDHKLTKKSMEMERARYMHKLEELSLRIEYENKTKKKKRKR